MAATENMSDAELREELQKLGFAAGPITDSTRKVLKKKLQTLKAGSAKSQKSPKERTKKSEGNTRRKRIEHIEDDAREDEEDDSNGVSAQPSYTIDRNRYGSSGGLERSNVRHYFDSKSATSPSSVRGSELWRSEKSSSLTESPLIRSSFGSSDQYKHGSSLGRDRLPRTTVDHSDYLEQRDRSSLGGESYIKHTPLYSDSLGQEARTSMGGGEYLRATSDYGGHSRQEDRTYLGGERFSTATSAYSSLGLDARSYTAGGRNNSNYSNYLGHEARSSLGGERLTRNTDDYSSPLTEARYSLGGERFTRTTPDYRDYPGQELRSRSTSDRSSWSSLPVNRDEGRPWLRHNEGDTKGQLFYKNYPTLSRKPPQSKPNWSKTLEYYLSILVRVLSVGLVIIFFGILLKSGIFYSTQQDDLKLIPPDCEGKDDKYCQVMQKHAILQILSELYNFLSLEAGSFECGNPSGLSSKCIPIKRAKEHVMNEHDHASEKFDSALNWMLNRDEHLGIWAKDEDGQITTSSSLVSCVESSRPHLGLACRLTNALYTALSNLFLALFGVFILWLFLVYLRYHWRKLEEEEKQMFAMVEKILNAVKNHHKDYEQRIEKQPYLGILHVRDTLIMPQDRKCLKKVWDRAVQFVEENESRIRTESQRVAGADLRVWRWTQTRHEILNERSSPVFSTWGK